MDKVHVSFGRQYRSREMSVARRYGVGDWIQPSDARLVEDSEGELATGPLGGFDVVSTSTTSFDVTIGTGEAVVRGAYLVRDSQTTVTVPSDATTTLYVGWQDGVADTVIVGPDGDFATADPQTEIATVTTDGSGVTGVSDLRTLGPTVAAETVDAAETLLPPVFQTVSDAPSLPEGAVVYIESEQQLFVEDGT